MSDMEAQGSIMALNAIDELETPCIVIENGKIDANIEAMAQAAARCGVALRPHAKTHKLPELALRQLAAGATGITVAKVSEAEVMAAGGMRDIFIAYSLVGAKKINRAIRLSLAGVRLIVGVDSLEGASRLSEAALAQSTVLEVRLEIDTGLHRTGVSADAAIALAKQIAALGGIRLSGIFTYRGAMLAGASTLDLQAAGHEEGRLMSEAARLLRDAGIAIEDVSVGSTPTAIYAAEIEGVTEIRPGTYIYQDRIQAAFGVCSLEACAATVLATVVSRPADDLVIIDGGSKTFATDVQPGHPPLYLQGFAHVVGDPEAVLARMNEEHGMISVHPSSAYRVGDRLRLVPNHICSTVNLHNAVYIVDEDGRSRSVPVAARGMLE
ncbi:alanine racemase [Paenibacillus harenae]|uniref:alanine racemase n=1 Tax=Paenibacillus harenae TaxID=306543 RepID=UPI0027933030|nr:alanine racemase [Paenibacillus harenae]MDQ0063578.1 D-serine deaminase-like pyridoxal phosphate-dependent protein [Paenibacillus harenae]